MYGGGTYNHAGGVHHFGIHPYNANQPLLEQAYIPEVPLNDLVLSDTTGTTGVNENEYENLPQCISITIVIAQRWRYLMLVWLDWIVFLQSLVNGMVE